jgi:hypothetical protein
MDNLTAELAYDLFVTMQQSIMDNLTAELAYDLFVTMQHNFCYRICVQLWYNNPQHYWNLWNESNNNMVLFLERNPALRGRLLSWGMELLGLAENNQNADYELNNM